MIRFRTETELPTGKYRISHRNNLLLAGSCFADNIGSMLAAGIGVGLEKDSYIAVTALENVYVELETVSNNAWKNFQNYVRDLKMQWTVF